MKKTYASAEIIRKVAAAIERQAGYEKEGGDINKYHALMKESMKLKNEADNFTTVIKKKEVVHVFKNKKIGRARKWGANMHVMAGGGSRSVNHGLSDGFTEEGRY